MSAGTDRWIRWTTPGCVALLALIAGTVSYLHMHMLVELHGQPGWVAALTPFSVDGMIVAASTTLLADSRSGGRGGILPWTLLVVGSVASLAANVAIAGPTAAGRVIAAWPSFALIDIFTDRHPVGSALTWAFTSRTCSRRPNQKISEEEAGAWRAPQVRILWSQANVADVPGPGRLTGPARSQNAARRTWRTPARPVGKIPDADD